MTSFHPNYLLKDPVPKYSPILTPSWGGSEHQYRNYGETPFIPPLVGVSSVILKARHMAVKVDERTFQQEGFQSQPGIRTSEERAGSAAEKINRNACSGVTKEMAIKY